MLLVFAGLREVLVFFLGFPSLRLQNEGAPFCRDVGQERAWRRWGKEVLQGLECQGHLTPLVAWMAKEQVVQAQGL